MTLHSRIVAAAAALAVFPAGAHPGAAPRYSAWSAPLNIGSAINSPATEAGPSISKDGLSLHFHSDRPGGFGATDISVSQRNGAEDPWRPPRNLGPVVNSDSLDNVASLSRDEHWLFFHSNRSGGFGGFDLWACYRAHTQDDFGWEAPVNLGPVINASGSEAGAAFFENDGFPLLFFGSVRPGHLGFDIYVSALSAEGFGPPAPVAELNSPASDQRPTVRPDGLELVLASDRGGTYGGLDLWVATRESTSSPWSGPENLGSGINSAATETQAFISPDRTALLFISDRPDGFGGFDLYMATRVKRSQE